MSDDSFSNNSVHFLSNAELEWMSLNYRKERATKLAASKKRMILIMFQEDISYFPSMKEIRDELIQAQIKVIQNRCLQWNKNTLY